MMQNLRRLFDRTTSSPLTEEVIQRFGQVFDSDSTGVRLSDILSDITSFGYTDGLPPKCQDLCGGKPMVLREEILHLLRGHGNPETDRPVHYETTAPFHSAVHTKGFKVCPLERSRKDSNIIYRADREGNWSAGQVTDIFTGSWIEHHQRMSQIFLVVEELAELDPQDIRSDVYRQFPALGARLCYDRVESSRVITLDSFICQFARKAYRPPCLQQDLVLVFPITKV